MKTEVTKWLESNYQNYLKRGNKALPQSEVDHIVDWMNSNEGESYLRRLDRVSVPAALDLAKKWTIQINKKNQKQLSISKGMEGVEVIYRFENGYSIVRLITKEAYQREGVDMGHCVGTYYTPEESDIAIYSLRDKENQAHCTIEFCKSAKSIDQVKGKENKPVVEKYHRYVVEFLNNFDFDTIYTYDLENINAIYFGNNIFLADELPKELITKKDLRIDMVNFIHQFDHLEIKGNAFMTKNRRCRKLAKKLVVHGDLVIEEFHGLLRLADEIEVKGSIEIVDCENIKLLGDKVKAYSVDVAGCDNFNEKTLAKANLELRD